MPPSPTGCSLNVNETTTPKLPQPPRSAQKSSVLVSAEASFLEPSASTTVQPTSESIVSPVSRSRLPWPPCSVRPPSPVPGWAPG
eukprot:scaffold6875_cov63-Phaeocystis_antarctica.AAC.3